MSDLAKTNESSALISTIERVAISPDADINKLEKLLDMQERVMTRQAQQDFSADLAAMQQDMPEVAERGKSHNGAYATLEDIMSAVRPVLVKYGFAVTFSVAQDQNQITVTGQLCHRSGHSQETSITLPADTSGSKNAVQSVGSTVSYGKRYTASALLNIATRGEDDDAAGAVALKKVSKFQAETLRRMAAGSAKEIKEWLRLTYGKAEDVPERDYNDVYERLNVNQEDG